MADYEFRYSPLTGRLTGKQMIEQTEQAINQLSSLVDSAAGQVEIISTLANESNENAATALEVANEALATTGRTYITVSTQTDANNYYDSQLIYIADSTSTNIPVADTGMLEVKTNDNKTACEQVFIAASSGDAYYRHGAITAETVGDVTTYSVTWSGWSSQPASQTYVQQELTNYLPLSGGTVTGGLTVTGTLDGTASGNLPLTGGGSITGDVDITGDLSVTGAITGNLTGSVTGNVTGTASGNLALTGGTMTGDIIFGNNEAYIQKQDESILGYNQFEIGWGRPETSAGTEWHADGAKMAFHSYHADNTKDDGAFVILATDGVNNKQLNGNPSGDLTWNGKNLDHTVDYSVYKTAQQFTAPTIFSSRVKDLGGGYKKVGNIVYVYVRFRLNTTLAKGGWSVLNNFPTPYNMGFSDDYRIPLIATAWYGDNYSGNVSSAFMDSGGAIWLITNGQMESTNTSNYFIYVYGTYYAE